MNRTAAVEAIDTMKTYAVTVNGLEFVQAVIARLAYRSQWFSFEPLPDDDYEVTVKVENKSMIDRIVVEVIFGAGPAGLAAAYVLNVLARDARYNAEKDVLIEDLGQVGETGLFAEVRRYDNKDGEPGVTKLSVYRVFGKAGDKRKALFRLPYNEVTEFGEFMVEFTATHGTE